MHHKAEEVIAIRYHRRATGWSCWSGPTFGEYCLLTSSKNTSFLGGSHDNHDKSPSFFSLELHWTPKHPAISGGQNSRFPHFSTFFSPKSPPRDCHPDIVVKTPRITVGSGIPVEGNGVRVESLAESGRIDLTMVKIATGTMGRSWSPLFQQRGVLLSET